MKLRFWLAAGGLLLVPLALSAAPKAAPAKPEPGEIPESAKVLRNPVQRTDDVVRGGRALWREHCETCHGSGGRGDGPSARLHELRKNVAPRDLTEAEVQEMADGEIYWRITNGFIDGDNIIMPAYRNKVPLEVQRWQLVVYVRELGKAGPRK